MVEIDSKTDLTGMKFGKWTVLSKALSKSNRKMWLCKCECGLQKEVSGRSLRAGRSKACASCAAKDRNPSSRAIKDETGKIYGRLTVLQRAKNNIHEHCAWICRCKCGNIIEVNGEYLRSGGTKSCGCLRTSSYGVQKIKEILKDNSISYLTEKTFPSCYITDSSHPLRFDFYITKDKYLIDFDGPQHEKAVGWGTEKEKLRKFQKTQEYDKFKNKWCIENKIPLIRIPYSYRELIQLEDLIPKTSKFLYKGEDHNDISG